VIPEISASPPDRVGSGAVVSDETADVRPV